MAKKVNQKLEQLIRKLNYKCVKVKDINHYLIRSWSNKNIPQIVDQLKPLGWNLEKEDTWTELVFINLIIDWYDKKVALYATSSYLDFNKAFSVIQTKEFKLLRQDLNIDCHCSLLIDPNIFLAVEDLDVIYVHLDFNKGFCSLDLSHYDAEDRLDDCVKEDWGWLDYLDNDPSWSNYQINKFKED